MLEHNEPCRNPSCPSYGKPHPNCRCYAQGGQVSFCSGDRKHSEDCEYYADGGPVAAPLDDGGRDNPSETVEHSALHHGLLGVFKGAIGSSKLAEPEKHSKILDEAKNQHRFRGLKTPDDGKSDEAPKRTHGAKFGDKIFDGDHAGAADHMQDHPLMGSVGKTHLEPILARLSGPILENDSHPEALRGAVDYLHSSVKGAHKLGQENVFEKGDHKPDLKTRSEFKAFLDEVDQNPQSLFEASGTLGHYLPDHAGALGATLGNAITYLKTLKPTSPPKGPLDPPQPVDPLKEDKYNRAIDVVQDPRHVLQSIREGTVSPGDVLSLKTVYPNVHKKMVSQVTEQLIDSQAEGKEVPYKMRLAMATFLEQPLDGTMTSQAMMAIIKSASPAQQQQASPGGGKGPTEQTQKTIAKTDSLYQTPLDKLQIDKKD